MPSNNSNNSRSGHMVTIIPVTLNNTQKAFAVVDATTGLWGFRASGSTAFAFTYEKMADIAKKVTGWHAVPPQGFTGFGHVTPVVVARPVTPAVAPTPAPKAEEPVRHRTVAQAAAWLQVCERNLAKCEAGVIGGNVEKYRKGVETARQTLSEAQARETSTTASK
jgi:hypothetical protein